MVSAARRRYIDLTRGLAVLVMIEAHTVDAWTRLADRSTQTYRNLIVLGGFAAPLFLWLAGLAAVMGAERMFRRTADRRAVCVHVCRRGLLIFLLAFLFKLQSFVLSPGNPLVILLRVDILNIMGPSLIAAGVLWACCRGVSTRTLSFALAATAVAMFTPVIRLAGWVDSLPRVIQWYLRPAGEHTVFTLFPWGGFVFAGGAMGALLTTADDDLRSERRLLAVILAGGAGLVVLGVYTASLPSIYRESSFWTSSPTYFALRVGIMMMALPVTYWTEVALGSTNAATGAIERLGRSSLFVYWIHVELVYGYLSWPLRHHLHVYQTLIAYGVFCLLMYGAVVLRDRIVGWWRSRKSLAGPAEVVSA